MRWTSARCRQTLCLRPWQSVHSSPVRQPATSQYGTEAPGTVLIGLGSEAVGVLILVSFMGPDTNGWIIAAQWSLVAATAFLALGFVGALRVRRAAGEKGAPANNADLGARVNRVQN